MEDEFEEYLKSVWCLIYSMRERGVKGDDPWWGQDFLRVEQQSEKLLTQFKLD